MANQGKLRRPEFSSQRFDVVHHCGDRVITIHRSFGPAAAPLIVIDHAQLALHEGPGKRRKMLAPLSGPAMQKNDWRGSCGCLTADDVIEPHAVQDYVMRSRRERRGVRIDWRGLGGRLRLKWSAGGEEAKRSGDLHSALQKGW